MWCLVKMWVVFVYEVLLEKVVDGVMLILGVIFNFNFSRGGIQLFEGGWYGYYFFFFICWVYRIGILILQGNVIVVINF